MASGEPTDRELAGLLVRVLSALILLLASAGIAAAVDLRSGDDGDEAAVAVGPADGIGPVAGSSIDGYLAERPGALGAATGQRAAVVSFTTYLDEPSARGRLAGVGVERWFVATPGGPPVAVDAAAPQPPGAPVVFGALVVGESSTLRAIAATPGVRLVDVGVDATPPQAARAVRPEETRRAGVPATRPS